MIARRLVPALFLLTAMHGSAAAQRPVAPLPIPHTLVGFVHDTLGNPVDSVLVFIPSEKRRVMTTADGKFRFDDVKPGTYDVSARRLGYLPLIKEVVVAEGGGTTTFRLVPIVRTLAPVVTTVDRGGLSGVVGDTGYNIIQGAQVHVISTDLHAATDSMGRFFLDVKPGKYMVNFTAPGYASRLMSVNVPGDSGRRIVAWLAPTTLRASRMEAFNLQELGFRMDTMPPVRSRRFTREDINRVGYEDLLQMANAGAAGKRVDESCWAYLDGGPDSIPIWGLAAADLEFVEVYTKKDARRAPTSIMNNKRVSTQVAPQSDCPVRIYAWLRK